MRSVCGKQKQEKMDLQAFFKTGLKLANAKKSASVCRKNGVRVSPALEVLRNGFSKLRQWYGDEVLRNGFSKLRQWYGDALAADER
jgi:hypothetical protein